MPKIGDNLRAFWITDDPSPYIAMVLAAAEVQDRLADQDRAAAFDTLVARKPQPRPTMRSEMIKAFDLTQAEAQFFDRLRSQYHYSAAEAAKIIIADRKKSPTGEGA